MKSALVVRSIFTAGICAIALFIFIGINVGYELPSDRTLWFGAACALGVALVAYGRYCTLKPKTPATEAETPTVKPHAS
jgi:hypothetical protein